MASNTADPNIHLKTNLSNSNISVHNTQNTQNTQNTYNTHNTQNNQILQIKQNPQKCRNSKSNNTQEGEYNGKEQQVQVQHEPEQEQEREGKHHRSSQFESRQPSPPPFSVSELDSTLYLTQEEKLLYGNRFPQNLQKIRLLGKYAFFLFFCVFCV